MKGISKNAKIGVIIVLIIVVLAIIAINPTGVYSASELSPSSKTRDIALTDIVWVPQNPDDNDNVQVYGVITNAGNTTIPGGSKIEFYLWYDGAIQHGLNYTIPLNESMLPGATRPVYLDSQVFTAGNHQIKVRIKPYFTDSNPNNHERTETIFVAGQPNQTTDVGLNDIFWVPQNPDDNDNVAVSGRIRNEGQTTIPAGSRILFDLVYDNNNPQPQLNYTLNSSWPPAEYRDVFVDYQVFTAGNHQIQMTIYPYFQDSNPSNNGRTEAIIVAQQNQTSNPPTVNVSHTSYYNATSNMSFVTITAEAWDDVDLTNIKVYADNILRRTCTLSGIQTHEWCTYEGFFALGNHTYYATATDSDGQTTQSQVKYFTVP